MTFANSRSRHLERRRRVMPTSRIVRLFAILPLELMLWGASFASVYTASGPIQPKNPWVRWLPADLPAAGYLTIINSSSADAFLIGASSSDYTNVELHESYTAADGTARMRPVRRLRVPAGGVVEFRPGGYHLMLIEARHRIEPGDTVNIELLFADGGRLPVRFPVKPAGQRQ